MDNPKNVTAESSRIAPEKGVTIVLYKRWVILVFELCCVDSRCQFVIRLWACQPNTC